MATILILGAGMMGTAFAWPLADRGHRVRLVGTHLDADLVRAMRATGEHPKLGLPLPRGVDAYPLEELRDAVDGVDAVALGVSSAGVKWAAATLQPLLEQARPLAMVSKGLAWNGSRLAVLPDVFLESWQGEVPAGLCPVGVAGPCIAGELARRVETSVVFAARSREAAETWAELCRGDYYHVWSADDVVGVEVCAALKNAYAMGIAFASGLHEARGGSNGSIALHNYEASVFAQSVWEMRQLIKLLGGDPEHASWLPGVGDLNVTCNGGRTGRFGKLLGQGLTRTEAISRMQGATLECLEILANLRQALDHYVAAGQLAPGAFPLAEHLAEVALDGAPVKMPFARFFAQGESVKRNE